MPTTSPRKPVAPPQPPPQTPQTMAGAAAAASALAATPAAAASLALSAASLKSVEQAGEALSLFFSKLRARNDDWMTRTYGLRVPSGDLARAKAEEAQRQQEFERRAHIRFKANIAKALGERDAVTRSNRAKSAIANERRYAVQRQEMVAQRAQAAVDRQAIRRESPQGAAWVLDPSKKTHTPECVAMAGKVWPWEALDRHAFYPPVHGGCGCYLVGYKQAVAGHLVPAGAVPNADDAIRAVSRIMGLHNEESVLDGLDLSRQRAELVQAGLITRERFDAAIAQLVEEELNA